MSDTCITSGKTVRDMVRAGWELWHIPVIMNSPLPGRWELRHRSEPIRHVHWDAIISIRKRYLDWFEAETEEIQEGRYTWCYRTPQANLALSGGTAS